MDPGTVAAGAAIAFAIATVTTPAGVSGAVLLVPVQVSILGVANPAVTPTNLLYNVIATPGGLAGYRQWDGRLTRVLLAGTGPGVVVGSVLRVTVLDGPSAFYVVIAVVLLPLSVALLLGRRLSVRGPRERWVVLFSLAVGIIGGIYGIGGGSILAPALAGMGLSIAAVAPAALATTLVTSLIGVVAFSLLSIAGSGDIAPEWPLGIAMGLGGLVGGYCGARLQPRLPPELVRRGLGLLTLALAVRYAALGIAGD